MTDDRQRRRDAAAREFYEQHRRRQLARLSTGGFVRLHDRADPQAQLARRVGAALVEAGFVLYDRVAETPLGGAMIMPRDHPDGGVYVGWTLPDPLSRDDSRPALRAHVVTTMNRAVHDVLFAYGFDVGEHPHPMLVTLGPEPERALEEELDEFGEHVVGLCTGALPHGDIPAAWPVADQVAVALVLLRHWHLQEHLNTTPREAALTLFSEVERPPADPIPWVRSLRAVLNLPALAGTPGADGEPAEAPLTVLRAQAEYLLGSIPPDDELARVWQDPDFAAATEVFGWEDPQVRDRFRLLLHAARGTDADE